MKEINLAGIYVAPFALFLVLTALVFFPLRWLLDRYEVERWVWHRPLFDLSLFVIILSIIGLLF